MEMITPLSLYLEFGWVADSAFSQHQLSLLDQVGRDLLAYAEKRMPGAGRAWLLRFLSPLRVHSGGAPQRLASWYNRQGTSIVFPYRDIWLAADFELRANSRLHIAHELAHVLDNILARRRLPATVFGGGPADRLIRDLGGRPRGLRFANGPCGLPPELRWTANGGYGNRSSAEYFAEAFAWSLYDPSRLPSPTMLDWLDREIFRL